MEITNCGSPVFFSGSHNKNIEPTMVGMVDHFTRNSILYSLNTHGCDTVKV
tara:strand:+ start:211 stop:363 length:153 start_codon:yes stop_codon:yes gene_type:complete